MPCYLTQAKRSPCIDILSLLALTCWIHSLKAPGCKVEASAPTLKFSKFEHNLHFSNCDAHTKFWTQGFVKRFTISKNRTHNLLTPALTSRPITWLSLKNVSRSPFDVIYESGLMILEQSSIILFSASHVSQLTRAT